MPSAVILFQIVQNLMTTCGLDYHLTASKVAVEWLLIRINTFQHPVALFNDFILQGKT
jgi:hypothetical protein